jgi:hypothetical protein
VVGERPFQAVQRGSHAWWRYSQQKDLLVLGRLAEDFLEGGDEAKTVDISKAGDRAKWTDSIKNRPLIKTKDYSLDEDYCCDKLCLKY